MDSDDRTELTFVADAVVIDLAANAIRIRVPGLSAPPGQEQDATLDVGGNGRLIGMELGEAWISVMDLPDARESYIRSADVQVHVSADTPPSVTLPRRGPGYEITYPSGNECWQMKSVGGELIQVCATTGDEPGALHDAHALRSRGPAKR